MLMWAWVIGLAALLVAAAMWLDRRRGSSNDYRSADLPATKKGTATDSVTGWEGPGL